jgi:hypothetical protein
MLLVAQEFLGRVLTVETPQTPVPLAVVVAARAELVETRLLAATELLVMVERVVPMRYKRDQTLPMQVAVAVLVLLVALRAQVVLVEAETLLGAVEQQTLAAAVPLAFQAAAYGRLLATAAPASSSFDTGLRNGSFCTNRRTRHGADSHRGEQQRHLGCKRPRV